MKKIFFCFLFVSFILTLIRIKNVTYSNCIILTKSPNIDKIGPVINKSCDDEWTIFNSHVYFRNNLIFYFIDRQVFEIYYERRSSYNFNFTLMITHDSIYSEIQFLNVSKLHQHSEYAFEFIHFKYTSNEINFNTKINVYIRSENSSLKLDNVLIKNYTESNDQNHNSAICGKVFYFEPKFVKKFEWWIELNRLNGFDKIIFFNNSLPSEFDFIKEKYLHFVEVVQFNCIPNFLDPNNNQKKYIKSFYEIINDYKYDPLYYHMHFEYLTQNECYLTNMNKYKYIAILDQDETVLQRKINKYKVLNNSLIETKDFYKSDECSLKKTWISYLKDLKSKLKSENKLDYIKNKTEGESFHFLMTLYLKHYLIEQLFHNIGIYLKAGKFHNFKFMLDDRNDTNFLGQKGVNFTILIESQSDFEYAKKLYDLYNREVIEFLNRNSQNLKMLPENFSRLFFVNGDTTSWMCGKSIHNPKWSHWISTHYPVENNFLNMIWTPHEYGHVSHFRESLKDLHQRNISISNIKFDFNYFLCFFKPIILNLNYTFFQN